RENRRGLRSLFREDGVGLLIHGNGLGFLAHGDRFRFGFDLDRFRLLGLGWLNDDESGLARGGGFRDGRGGRSRGLDLRIHEHALPWRLGGSNKAISMIPKNEILLREFGRGPRKTLLPQRPIGSPRHHSSVGRAAAL